MKLRGLNDAELFLNVLQRHAFRLGHHEFHAAEEEENPAGRKGGDHPREESGGQRGEDPVREAAERLPSRTML